MVAFIKDTKPDCLVVMSWSNDRLDDRKAPLTIKRLNSFLFNLALESIGSIVIIIEEKYCTRLSSFHSGLHVLHLDIHGVCKMALKK